MSGYPGDPTWRIVPRHRGNLFCFQKVFAAADCVGCLKGSSSCGYRFIAVKENLADERAHCGVKSLRPLQQSEEAHVVEDCESDVWLLRPNEKDQFLSTGSIWLHRL